MSRRTTYMPGLNAARVSVYTPDEAEQQIHVHLLSDAGGRCEACGGMQPCSPGVLASIVLNAEGRLPQRRRGATLRGGAFAWLRHPR